MANSETHQPWTLCGLIGAFINLALAYFLLCASTCAFFASKFLGIVGLRLPCPCQGFFGFERAEFCWHRLLIELPFRLISDVQILLKSRFPFGLVWFENESKKLNREGNCESRVVEAEGEACCSSFSGPRIQNLADRDSGSDVKGKRPGNSKQKYGIRRRKRATFAFGKFASDGLSSAARDFPSCYGGRESEDGFGNSRDFISDDVNTQSRKCKEQETCQSLELSASFAESNDTADHPFCFEKYMKDFDEKGSAIVSESDTIRSLKRALAEEKSVCASLFLELEKERAAAATAADEAMAMISRLQKDKASMEIETRQYERMIEEKFAYDEEEIDVLKEILVRRERENHFLEKEIETYRRMSVTGDEQSYDDISDTLDDWGQRPLSSPYSSADPKFTLRDNISPKNNVQIDTYFPSEVPFVEKQSRSDGHELIEKTIILMDHVDSLKLSSVPEDMDSCRYSDEN